MVSREYKHLYNSKQWKQLRQRVFLRDHYICQVCGRPVIDNHKHEHAAIANHKQKHNGAPELFFDEDNVETVGKSCHDGYIQSLEKRFGQTHPHWLEPSGIPIDIVCGPPGAGKTTYCKENMQRGDIIIDLDDIRQEAVGSTHCEVDSDTLGQMLFVRNRRLSNLKHATKGKAFFIVGAPTPEERDWWKSKLGGNIVLLKPSLKTCMDRVKHSGSWRTQAVRNWFHPKPFKPRQPVKEIGLDGWPVE